MKPGSYTVQSWNNKDAVLIGDDGEFLPLTKNELPKEFGGQLFVGEKVEIVLVLRLQGGISLDERYRSSRVGEITRQNMSRKQRDFIEAENERRRLYGVKPL